MGYKNENLKHRQGFASKPKYTCPHCKNGLNIPKPVFMTICSSCKKTVKGEDISK